MINTNRVRLRNSDHSTSGRDGDQQTVQLRRAKQPSAIEGFMVDSMFNGKRTRSQLTLPDDLFSRLPQQSPMKSARTALKMAYEATSKDVEMTIVDDSEDEILLSPGKRPPLNTRVSKRSVSPLPEDEHLTHSDSPSERRKHKRFKRDGGSLSSTNGEPSVHASGATAQRFVHVRSFSQPDYERNPSVFNKDVVPGKGRAQSVPTFPQSSVPSIMRIDLRNPPLSPRRPRSRSPSKERELRITSEPKPLTRLNAIPDEAGMQVDVEIADKPNQQVSLHSLPHVSITSQETTPARSQTLPRSEGEARRDLSTPITQEEFDPFMSPLTPLPETPPLPSKSPVSTVDRYSSTGWGTAGEEHEDKLPPLEVELQKRLPSQGKASQSKLPRPSNAFNAPPPPLPSAVGSSSHAPPRTPTMNSSLATPAVKKSTAINTTTSQIKGINAFTLLMQQAHRNKEKGKAKVKENSLSTKQNSVAQSGSKVSSGNAAGSRKGKGKEIQPPKGSIKSQMKPKRLSKSKPVITPPPKASLNTHRSPTPLPSSPIDPPDHERTSSPSNIETAVDINDPVATATQTSDTVETSVSMESLSLDPLATSPVLRVISELPPDLEQHQPLVTIDPLVKGLSESEANSSVDLAPLAHSKTNSSVVESIFTTTITTVATELSAAEGSLPAETSVTNSIPESAQSTATNNNTMTEMPIAAQSSALKAPTKRGQYKRIPVAVTPRITRSSSLRQNQISKIPGAVNKTLGKQGKLREPGLATNLSAAEYDVRRDAAKLSSSDEQREPTASPKSLNKFDATATEAFRALGTSDAQLAPAESKQTLLQSPTKLRPPKFGTPSPSKLPRSFSLHASQPNRTISRAFSEYSIAGSSLLTLSSALEKLHQPPPERPSTSLGFNRDADSAFQLETSSKDDSSVVASSSNTAQKPVSLVKSRSTQRALPDSARSLATGKTIFGSGTMMRGSGGFKIPGLPNKNGSRLFSMGNRTVQKASRKTSLPSVVASPLKGGGRSNAEVIDTADDVDDAEQSSIAAVPSTPGDQTAVLNSGGKGKQSSADSWLSKRSSQVYSQSLSVLPANETPQQEAMGPPATPTRSKGANGENGSSPHSSIGQRSPSTRMSLRIASNASRATATGSKVTPANHIPEPLKILKDCVIFVDVRTDDGEEAGSLFVEMLEGAGARILTRVGQTCTHLVFKNGLMSTLTRYRLLRDPKPRVVGIAWVVECIEQMKHVDETHFLVDLEGVNISGTNKRRRSMLPKMIAHEPNGMSASDVDGDVSMDGSNSSMSLDDDLTPLEKARRRKAAASS